MALLQNLLLDILSLRRRPRNAREAEVTLMSQRRKRAEKNVAVSTVHSGPSPTHTSQMNCFMVTHTLLFYRSAQHDMDVVKIVVSHIQKVAVFVD